MGSRHVENCAAAYGVSDNVTTRSDPAIRSVVGKEWNQLRIFLDLISVN